MLQKTIEKLEKTTIVQEYLNDASITELSAKYKFSSETIRQYLLRNGVVLRGARKRKSLREQPPIGQKFGQWTVISNKIKTGGEISGTNNRSLYWLCKCSCGEISWKSVSSLKSGAVKGCKKCCTRTCISEEGDIVLDTVLAHKYSSTKKNIPTRKNRGRRAPLTFNIDIKHVSDLYELQQHKCALSGISLEPDRTKTLQQQNLSIDRIDSFKGYEPDNIQLVDKRINMMKGSLLNDEFVELCTLVAEHHKEKDNSDKSEI